MKSKQRYQKLRKRRIKQRPFVLQLVSLMDIFTILVFFLLVNSTTPSELPPNSTLQLPSSLAEQSANDTLHIMITRTAILVNGAHVTSLDDLQTSPLAMPALGRVLERHAQRHSETQRSEGLPVTLFSHKETPYSVVKHVINTINQHHYTKLSLAVLRQSGVSPT